jgi:hypothetical protein
VPCDASDNRAENLQKDEAEWQFGSDSLNSGMFDEQLRQCAKEKWNAVLSFAFLCLAFFVSSVSLAFTHDRLPDRTTYKPLPDAFLDNLESREYLLNVTEMQIMAVSTICIALFIFHKHR